MQDLIAAKFDPPMWMGDQISRDLLLQRLHGVLTHRLTLIHAPAGYGKTSLLSQWRDSLDPRTAKVAWLTLERDDRDLKRFVKYLLLAGRRDRKRKIVVWGQSGSVRVALGGRRSIKKKTKRRPN